MSPEVSDDGQIIVAIKIDDRLESYKDVYGDKWPLAINQALVGVPWLSDATSNLLMQWRGVSYAVGFPPLIADQLSAFAASFVSQQGPNSNILKLADATLSRLRQAIPEMNMDPSLSRRIHNEIVELSARLLDGSATDACKLTPEGIWPSYLNEKPFRLTLWSSQRIGYMAVFNAYETFVVDVVRVLSGRDRLRSSDQDFRSTLVSAVGPRAAQNCWCSAKINVIRLVRHSLAHAGGRVTRDLEKVSHGIQVHENVIQVMPADLRAAYERLAKSVVQLLNACREIGPSASISP
jgi:hypothetical protein